MKIHSLFAVLIGVCLPYFSNAQSSLYALTDLTGNNTLKRSGNMRMTSDGGFIMAGTSAEYHWARACVIKLDAAKNIQWSKNLEVPMVDALGQTKAQASYGMDVVEVGSGNYVLLAAVKTNLNPVTWENDAFNELDYALVKFDGNGNILFSKRYGGQYNDIPFEMQKTNDGGFIVMGYHNYDQNLGLPAQTYPFLMKADANGVMQWGFRNPISNASTSGNLAIRAGMPRSVIQTSDGGFVYAFNHDDHQYIAKVSSTGNYVWIKHYQSASWNGLSYPDIAFGAGSGGTINKVRELPNGDLAFSGNHKFLAVVAGVNGGNAVTFPIGIVFITDKDGNFRRGSGFFHGTGASSGDLTDQSVSDFYPMPNGNLMITGNTNIYADGNGNTWYRTYAMEYNTNATTINTHPVRIKVAQELHYADTYLYGYDLPRLCLDPQNPTKPIVSYDFKLAEFQFGTINNTCFADQTISSFPLSLQIGNASLVKANLSGTDLNGVSFAAKSFKKNLLSCTNIDVQPIAEDNSIRIYPNPSAGKLVVEIAEAQEPCFLTILHPQGQVVHQQTVQHYADINMEHLPMGMYILRFQTNDKIKTIKWLKMN